MWLFNGNSIQVNRNWGDIKSFTNFGHISWLNDFGLSEVKRRLTCVRHPASGNCCCTFFLILFTVKSLAETQREGGTYLEWLQLTTNCINFLRYTSFFQDFHNKSWLDKLLLRKYLGYFRNGIAFKFVHILLHMQHCRQVSGSEMKVIILSKIIRRICFINHFMSYTVMSIKNKIY